MERKKAKISLRTNQHFSAGFLISLVFRPLQGNGL